MSNSNKKTEQSLNLNMQPISADSVVDTIINRLTQAILDGKLKPGDKLPTEFELAESLNVGRNSVREAIKVLTHFHVLKIIRPNGTFVADSFHEQMLDPLVFGLILQQDNFENLVGLRQVTDTGILMMAIEKKVETDKIEQALANLHDRLTDRDSGAESVLGADCAFHDAVNESLQNPYITRVASYIDRMTIPSRTITMQHILDSNTQDVFFDLHAKIVNVIKNRKPELVSESVGDHYRYWRQQ